MRGADVGLWLFLIGEAGALYFYLFFDISVDGRVVNLSLMQDRQLGMMLSIAIGVVGIVVSFYSTGRSKGERLK